MSAHRGGPVCRHDGPVRGGQNDARCALLGDNSNFFPVWRLSFDIHAFDTAWLRYTPIGMPKTHAHGRSTQARYFRGRPNGALASTEEDRCCRYRFSNILLDHDGPPASNTRPGTLGHGSLHLRSIFRRHRRRLNRPQRALARVHRIVSSYISHPGRDGH